MVFDDDIPLEKFFELFYNYGHLFYFWIFPFELVYRVCLVKEVNELSKNIINIIYINSKETLKQDLCIGTTIIFPNCDTL